MSRRCSLRRVTARCSQRSSRASSPTVPSGSDSVTRRKYRYILARWGYSPAIMAFELFNEVENTDAAHQGRWAEIAAWHREMAGFLRANDPNRHLITTSAIPGVALDNPVWRAVDYFQAHTYPFDVLATTGAPVPEKVKSYEPDRGQRPDTGYIAVQHHSGKGVVTFREITLVR